MQHKLRWWQKSPCHHHWWWLTTCFLARWLLQFVLVETERSMLELHFFSVPYLVLVPNLRWMDESSTRKLFIPSMLNRVRVILNIADFHFDFFIFQELPLAFPWTLLFSPSSRLFLFPLPSFITGSGADNSTFSYFTSTWTEALTLPATPSRQVVSSFPAFITDLFSFCPKASNHICRPL